MLYFEEAVDLLIANKFVKSKNGIGVCGISKGGEVALAMAATIPNDKLGAMAVMNTPLSFFGVDKVIYKGQKVCGAYQPPVPLPDNCFKEVSPNVLNIFALYKHFKMPEESRIQFTNCKTPLLMIAGSDDQISPSVEQAMLAKELMLANGKTNFEIAIYDGLGHLIDLPFSPPTTKEKHAVFPKHILIQMGGEDLVKHGQAQEKIWAKLLHFFLMHL